MALPILLDGRRSHLDTQDTTTDQLYPLGTAAYLGGRVWRFCRHENSTTLTRGELLVAEAIDAQHQNLDTNGSAFVVGAVTVPSGTVTLGSSAITANQYAEGYLMVVDGGGEATAYQIDSHDAGSSGGTDFTLNLVDPITITDDANTQVTLVQNKYKNPQQSNTATFEPILGVPNVEVPDGSSTAQHFWIQTLGFCPAFVVGTPAVGTVLMASDTTAGMLEERAETDADRAIGQMVTVGISGEVQVVDLQIQGL